MPSSTIVLLWVVGAVVVASMDQYVKEIANLKGQIVVLQKPKPLTPADPSGPNNAQLADSTREIARRFRSLQDDLNWHDKNEREAHANGANGPIPQGFYNSQLQRI